MLKREAKKALTGLIYVPVGEVTILILYVRANVFPALPFTIDTLKNPPFLLCPQFWRASTPVEPWPHECSPYSGEHHFCIPPMSPCFSKHTRSRSAWTQKEYPYSANLASCFARLASDILRLACSCVSIAFRSSRQYLKLNLHVQSPWQLQYGSLWQMATMIGLHRLAFGNN